MILFKMTCSFDEEMDLARKFNGHIYDLIIRSIESAVFLSDLQIEELQKHTNIPLQEITFEELLKM